MTPLNLIKESIIIDKTTLDKVLLLPLLAIFLSLIAGAILLLLTGETFFSVLITYKALFYGAFGSINAVSETLTAATPLILAGLGIALGFRAGLFNIGAEGQIIIGGLVTTIVGFSVTELSPIIHISLALISGALAGAIYAFIAGWLKAYTGAHEVISTIMLNLIALRLLDFFLRTPFVQKEGRNDPISKSIMDTSALPRLLETIDPQMRLHLGFVLALVMVLVVHWILFYTTLGFEFRATGANSDAAKYAGIRAPIIIVLAMALAGLLAGFAGAIQITGVLGRATPGFSSGIGFDAIAVALLGRAHPIGVLFSGLLFGALVAGGRQMQVTAGVSIDLITIIQSLIIIFIAAPMLVQNVIPWIFKSSKKT